MTRRRQPENAPEVPEDLTDDEKRRLMAWVRTRYPHLYTPGALRRLTDECLAHWGARKNPHRYHDWYRAVQKWITKDQHFANQRMEARPELPQEQGPRDSDLTPIIDLAQRRKA